MQLVLSLFPGADLLGRAFSEEGFSVVRGPDTILGQDIRTFHVPSGRFDGIIGGPPCQQDSIARRGGPARHPDMKGDFLRIVDEARPRWAVMEGVLHAKWAGWPSVVLSDYACGGCTKRKRRFWFYGIPVPALIPDARGNQGSLSVLATSHKSRPSCAATQLQGLKAANAFALQGFSGLDEIIRRAWPKEVSAASMNAMLVMLAGNGVPHALGRWVAQWVRKVTDGEER